MPRHSGLAVLCAATFAWTPATLVNAGPGQETASMIVPPVMSPRAVAPPTAPEPGERLPLEEAGVRFLLFLPEGWTRAPSGRLAMYFHVADWLAIAEHRRAGYTFPLALFTLGTGSERYRVPFQGPETFPAVLRRIESALVQRHPGAPPIHHIDVASFSAGYGAVRELVKQPAPFAVIRRIALADSLYGGLVASDPPGSRTVDPQHIDCWVPFAREAVAGSRAFVLTHTRVVTTSYASTAECAAALAAAVGVASQPPPPALPAAREPGFPLLSRADAGRFHIWDYAGTNALAHATHMHHLGDVWRALDAEEAAASARP